MGLTKANFKTKPRTEVILDTSWDDGGELDMKIAKLLKGYELSGTFYIIVGRVGTEGYLTWDQIKELDKQGFDIGSHTMSHPQDLKPLFDDDLHFEIQNSKDMIETVLGHSISKFCYPRGRYDQRVQEQVIKAKYTEARGTGKPGILTDEDKYGRYGTIHIFDRPEYNGTSIFNFAKEVIDRLRIDGGYCNIFGHSAEIERENLWGTLEEVLAYVKKG